MDQTPYEDRLHAWELASRRSWELEERRRLSAERERVRSQGLVERRAPEKPVAAGALMPNDPNDPTTTGPVSRPWDPSRPDVVDDDEARAYERQRRLRHVTPERTEGLLRRRRDIGGGEPLMAAESELPTGPVAPTDYNERAYWALAILLIGVAALIATIIGNLVAAPFVSRAPEPMQHSWPWVLSTLAGVLAGLMMGFTVWPKDHYARPWWPAIVATLSGLLVASGVFFSIWLIFGFFV